MDTDISNNHTFEHIISMKNESVYYKLHSGGMKNSIILQGQSV